ncbi:MAG: hypothetical protein M5U31_09870 [Acidimicrobiia bacterium]|nr:hypothetical protein [Acidimicrobiia bacterium]
MPFVVALVALGILLLLLVIRFATESGPTPEEVALAYEEAWDRFDFASVWELSGMEIRDGRSRNEFVAAKRAAFADRPSLDRLTGRVLVEDVVIESQRANVRTSLGLDDGSPTGSDITMERRDGRWQVVAYTYTGGSDIDGTGSDDGLGHEIERWG